MILAELLFRTGDSHGAVREAEAALELGLDGERRRKLEGNLARYRAATR